MVAAKTGSDPVLERQRVLDTLSVDLPRENARVVLRRALAGRVASAAPLFIGWRLGPS